ncbi:hypothetical protein FNH09_45290 [Streptomyces adustus]|uniref:Uncharacterized protein n=1 Tax=Streptomyces adustus TaxID=1609272 RepID=A0A5N8VTQ0_9ACTN|nr:hypothetical protein [Streptomyces adustus]MPY38172.1 hypothetical protein [Streptomyces adustus]
MNAQMPARPKIPNPADGRLQKFAYDLRLLGADQAPVAWIAQHPETTVSRAALYAALSGTRLPTHKTVGTLLRWWAGNPMDERPAEPEHLHEKPGWAWINRLPVGHEGAELAVEWMTRYERLVRDILFERDYEPRAPRVTISVPPEQQRFITELSALIGETGLQDDRWLLFDTRVSRVERYLAGEAMPTDEMFEWVVDRCMSFAPALDDYMERLDRLELSLRIARAARVRDRRHARTRRAEHG